MNLIKEKFTNILNIFKKHHHKVLNKKVLFFVIIPIFCIILIVQSLNFIFDNITAPNSYFLNRNISLKTPEEVKNIIIQEKNKLLSREIIFQVIDQNNQSIFKKYLLENFLEINTEDKILKTIFRKTFKPYYFDLGLFKKNLFNTKDYNLSYNLNNQTLENIKANFDKYQIKTENASIKINENTNEFIIKKEVEGFYFDYSKMEKDILDSINLTGDKNTINIKLNKVINEPIITEVNLQSIVIAGNEILKKSPISLYYNDKLYKLTKKELANWVEFNYSVEGGVFREVNIKLKKDEVTKYLDYLAQENDILPNNGEIEFKDNKVIKFVPITKGYKLDKEDSYTKIQNTILNLKNEVYLTIIESLPTSNDSEVAKQGFLEIIGEGVSDFKGSSTNRVHNIKTGSGYVGGTIVEPNKEFSLLTTLGGVSAQMGYVQELVIKGNRTEKEYGGGLCQVGTTIFRAALNGGFPIIERKNHSYRVSYYEPAGTDATIYYPKPDFRFLNNSKNKILILTEISGTKLIYKIWGTKDNRKIKISEPIITNIVSAPGTKWIETLDLKPGQTRCTESAHNGADAEFSYYVEYEDGTKFEKVFKSHYVPWQAVCLKGVEKLSETANLNDATQPQGTANPAQENPVTVNQ